MTSWLTTVLLAGFTVNHETRMPEVPVPVPEVPADASADVVRGAWLYRVAACVGCHSPPFADAQHLGGGRDLPTQFGTFYAPNISPDPTV
jgi:mono/diheme cytochrome c family protein